MRSLLTLITLLVVAAPAVALGERVGVDPPMKLVTLRADRSEVAGQITAYDEDGFDLKTATGEKLAVRWDELPPQTILQVHERLWTTKGTAEQWASLGERIVQQPNGRPHADRAFARAVRLDPALKARVDEARQDAAAKPASATPPNESAGDDTTTSRRRPGRDRDRGKPPPGGHEPAEGEPAGGGGGGPRTVGAAEPDQWGTLTEADHAAAIEQLKRVAERAQREVAPKLVLYETRYFLFYSDLRRTEAETWAGLLDRMYARLAALFAVPAGHNLWRGKALVFVFNREEDFQTFERVVQETDPAGMAGLCHQYGDGQVRIAFYRQPSDAAFAHVLVHESVHGFLHRYRSPARIPTWANEGLAEVIAAELVDTRGRRQTVEQRSREYLRARHGVGPGFFAGRTLEPGQYPVAETLCAFMIRENKPGYVAFINAIKDGAPWEQALNEKYGAPVDRILGAYGETLGIRGVTRGGGGGESAGSGTPAGNRGDRERRD